MGKKFHMAELTLQSTCYRSTFSVSFIIGIHYLVMVISNVTSRLPGFVQNYRGPFSVKMLFFSRYFENI